VVVVVVREAATALLAAEKGKLLGHLDADHAMPASEHLSELAFFMRYSKGIPTVSKV
jgi:hypothetical protein